MNKNTTTTLSTKMSLVYTLMAYNTQWVKKLTSKGYIGLIRLIHTPNRPISSFL